MNFALLKAIRAISSVGERCLHTAEVGGSKPPSPTIRNSLHADSQKKKMTEKAEDKGVALRSKKEFDKRKEGLDD